MAKPVGFEGANHIYQAPEGRDDVGDLECFVTETEVISCWRLSDEELAKVAKTGVIWLSVQSRALPPVLVSGDALVLVGDRESKAEPVIPKKARK